MSSLRTKATPDKVEKATASIRTAVSRLVGILGDEDLAVVEKTAGRLIEIGPFAIPSLATALPRSTTPWQAIQIIAVLQTIGQQHPGPAQAAVGRVLIAGIKNGRRPDLQAFAANAISSLIMSDLAQSPPSNASGRSDRLTS